MVSPTPNKNFTFDLHGAGLNSWDTPLNTNFEQMDSNLAANLSISLAAGSVVLSIAQAYNLSYTLTGLLVGNVTVTWPAVGGFYIVDNQTTGAFTVTLLSVGGGTTVLAPQGFVTFVWANSAAPNDMKVVMSSVTGAFNITGATTIGGVLTLSVTSYMSLPNGTTAQRPGTPTAGYLRFNSTLGTIEFGDGTSWNQPSIGQPVAAGFKNLRIGNNSGTPNSIMDITADAVTLENSSGTAFRVSTVSVSPSSAASGANGLDTGVVAASTWYSIWVIYNPTTATTAGMFSIQSTANATFLSNLPAGYTFYARLGWNITDSSNRFLRILQKDHDVQYVVSSSVTTALPAMITGVSGSISIPTWTAVSVSNYVPSTAAAIKVVVRAESGNTLVAPNNLYADYTSNTNPPPINCLATSGNRAALIGYMLLETTNVYYANSSATGGMWCFGWQDNI